MDHRAVDLMLSKLFIPSADSATFPIGAPLRKYDPSAALYGDTN
jgi:hypothetical protein